MIFGDTDGEGGMVIPGVTAKNNEEIPRTANFAPSLPDVCGPSPVCRVLSRGGSREPQGGGTRGCPQSGAAAASPGPAAPSRPS